jgi:large subunit ribosomal protein L6
MSRIGYLPIPIPTGVQVDITDNTVAVKGPNGELSFDFMETISVATEDGAIRVARSSEEKQSKALHGLTRSIVNNMVVGVSAGFTRSLELVGVGYRVAQNGPGITLNVMYSHPVNIEPPEGITMQVEGNNRIHVRGIDKQAVGQVAANIRKVRPPNIYTGKGIRYLGEQIRLKPGKSARRG